MNSTSKSKLAISGLTEEELIELVKSWGWPSFKGKELHSWIYKKNISSFEDMTNLSKSDRDKLEAEYIFSPLKMAKKEVSKDNTIKYLWSLKDNEYIESVRMAMEEGSSYTACISSQVGCAVGCVFCATGTLKLKRNLKASEIVEQVLNIQRDTKNRIKNIVYMGQGEPLQNYNEVIKSIHLIRDSVGIGARHITLSTSGFPEQIRKLAEENLPITLALSLHAPDQQTRELLVPISKKYKLAELMESVHYFYNETKRRITIEYVMLEDLNDSIDHAKALGDLLRGLHCHINLIPYNPVITSEGPLSLNIKKPISGLRSQVVSRKSQELCRPDMSNVYKFKDILEKTSRKKVTIRHEKGTDINAACGQLANKFSNSR